MDSVDWMRKELLEEIDRILIGSEFWQGGRFDTIKWMMERLKATNPVVEAAVAAADDFDNYWKPETRVTSVAKLIDAVQTFKGK